MSIARAVIIVVAIAASATPLAGQGAYAADMLRDLPAGSNVFALLESAQPEITTDRFNSGGLNAGDPERASGFLASWSQTRYLIGDALISSPVDGTPMLFPELAWWDHVNVVNTNGGLTIGLTPRRLSGRWGGEFEAIGSGGALTQPSSPSRPPAIQQLHDFTHLSGLLDGATLKGKLSFTIGAAFTRAATVEREADRRRDTRSVFLNAAYVPGPGQVLRGVLLMQEDSRHFLSTYLAGQRWQLMGAFTSRARDAAPARSFRQADRVFDGPIPSLIESRVDERRWSVGTRFTLAQTARHGASGSIDIERSSSSTSPLTPTTIAERVAGIAARLWQYRNIGAKSQHRGVMIRASVEDRIELTQDVTVHAKLGFESADASAEGATAGITWRTFLPALHLEWEAGTPLQLAFLTGVSRTADDPRLGLLDYGDPFAPTADVYRWDGAVDVSSPIVARVGPGTGGDRTFSAIDPDLKRPTTGQFILQLESRPRSFLTLRVTGIARRQSSLVNVVNIGAPAAAYSMFTVPDANADWVNPADDQELAVYNRRPVTFGQDRYLLTNPDVDAATMGALVVSGAVNAARCVFLISGTASASVGSGANRGFTAIENDQAALGELFTNPNASTYARGRLFNDRAYTIKSATVVRLPSAIRVGVLARYQDGQPFSRLTIVEGLDQGAEAIQTFPRGRSRFSYRATLDVRLQKRLEAGATRVDLIVDAYNLLNMATEVEEYVVTGPRFREITAVQPPRSFHLGARISF